MPRVFDFADYDLPDLPTADREIFRALHAGPQTRQSVLSRIENLGHDRRTVAGRIESLVLREYLRESGRTLEMTGKKVTGSDLNRKRTRTRSRQKQWKRTEKEMGLVRSALSERLDRVFEYPTSQLRLVLRAVESAARLVRPFDDGDRLAFSDGLAELRELLREAGGDLSAQSLLQSLQVGLFPEVFLEPSDTDEIAKNMAVERELKSARMKSIDSIHAENDQRAKANVRLAAAGQPLHPMIPVRYFEGESPRVRVLGLIPPGGGKCIGAARWRAFAEAVLGRKVGEKLPA